MMVRRVLGSRVVRLFWFGRFLGEGAGTEKALNELGYSLLISREDAENVLSQLESNKYNAAQLTPFFLAVTQNLRSIA